MAFGKYAICGLAAAALLASHPWAAAAYRLPGTASSAFDPEVTRRLAIDRAERKDLFGLLSLTAIESRNTAAGLVLRGEALEGIGAERAAAQAYAAALGKDPSSEAAELALLRYLEISGNLGGLDVPAPPQALTSRLKDRTALLLGDGLLKKGDSARALPLLNRSMESSLLEVRVLAAASLAQRQVLLGDLRGAWPLVSSLRSPDTSSYTDLFYLVRGYVSIESGDVSRARESFLAIPPSSPFAAEALHGLSWALIGAGDLNGAAIRLAELIDAYPFSMPARGAAVDLALCYRDLGLHDLAVQTLADQMLLLEKQSQWLGSLRAEHLADGTDLMRTVDTSTRGQAASARPPAGTPSEARGWVERAAQDPEVRRADRIIAGIERLQGAREVLARRLAVALKEMDREIYWLALDMKAAEAAQEQLLEWERRLPVIPRDMDDALSLTSLERFSTEQSTGLIDRILSLEGRLDAMERAVQKARDFSPIVEGLVSSAGTKEEEQLSRVRRQAYDGLMTSRNSLSDLRSSLRSLTGQTWLSLKMQATRFQDQASARVTATLDRTQAALLRAGQARDILDRRIGDLRDASREMRADADRIERALRPSLARVQESAREARTARLLAIAKTMSEEVRLAQARNLYTSADIETSRMQELLGTLQKAIP